MNTTILRALRAKTRAWWKHQELREAGNIAEALIRERQSIRKDLDYLKRALAHPNAYVSCGRGGTALHIGCTTISSYAPIERFVLAELAVRLGVPLIDTRTVADPLRIIGLPLVAGDDAPDKAPWNSMSRVPLHAYIAMAEKIGATITNNPLNATAQ